MTDADIIKEALQKVDEKNRTFDIEQVLGILRVDDEVRLQFDDGGDNGIQIKLNMEQVQTVVDHLSDLKQGGSAE